MLIEHLLNMNEADHCCDYETGLIRTIREAEEYRKDLRLHTTITPELINAIVKGAERVGGISNMQMMYGRNTWRDHIVDGRLWFNGPDGSTHTIKIE